MNSIRVVKVIRSTVIPIKATVEVAFIDNSAIHGVTNVGCRRCCAESTIMHQDWLAVSSRGNVDRLASSNPFDEPNAGNINGLRGGLRNTEERKDSCIIDNNGGGVHFKNPHRYRPA